VNICVVTTRHAAKDDRIYYKEVLSLAKRYDKITLIAPNDRKRDLTFHPSVRFAPLKERRGFLGRCLMVADALNLLVKLRPDVCSFHDYDLAVALPFTRVLIGAELIYDVHEFYPMAAALLGLPRLIRRPFQRFVAVLEELAARRCSVVITAVDPLTERFRKASCHAVTIFNYVRLDGIEFNQQHVCQLLDRYQGKKVVIYHGSISPERGVFHMIQAMGKLRRWDPSIVLLLLGPMSESLLSRVNAQTTEFNLTGCIEHVPWVDHASVFDYISVARIGLVPLLPVCQYPQSLPIKLFEYMACGIPVLAADLPSIRPYVEQSMAGLLYDSTSPDALAAGVLRMLSDKDGLRRMGENGRRAVQEKWNWDKMEARLFEVYDELDAQIRQRRTGSGRGQTRSVPSR